MQYLIVQAKKRGTDELVRNLSVLIDGELNGAVGTPLMLDEGIIDVSVHTPGAEEITVEIENTTKEQPLKVVIEIEQHK